MSLKVYSSVQEFMEEQQVWLREELNGFPPYVKVVRRAGYHMIAGVVLDIQGNEHYRWASRNDNSGRITEITNCFSLEEPDFIVKASELDLLRIINNFETVKAHPFAAVRRYCTAFHPARAKDLTSLPKIIVLALTETIKYSLSYPQPSG